MCVIHTLLIKKHNGSQSQYFCKLNDKKAANKTSVKTRIKNKYQFKIPSYKNPTKKVNQGFYRLNRPRGQFSF